MGYQDVAAAMARMESVLRRRPSAGLHDDAPGIARWQGGLRTATRHLNGREMPTDMPAEFGGEGDEVTPGWMVRAGLASCTATCIAMAAAREGIELDLLEVVAGSRSDARGLLGMAQADGAGVYPGPRGMTMDVRIAARGVAPERLRALVETGEQASPMLWAIRDAQAVSVSVEVAS